ncbi:MAG: hypothetical protein OXC37_00050 [Bdellovibrionaceae bacterium]|nr:hypothetical protein [Pseudobdellovibrionaceae bacterium]
MKLVLVLFFSFLSHAKEYKKYERGDYICTDEGAIDFIQNPQDLDYRYFHFECEVIKGNDSIALPELYILADKHRHLLASDFLANYLRSNGNLDTSWAKNSLNEAIKYQMQTLAIIKDFSNYPSDDYKPFESDNEYELVSHVKLPLLYLFRYHVDLESVDDHKIHLVGAPNYEEERDLETYPDYNIKMIDSLDKLILYSEECANLPQKAHFHPITYQDTIKVCDSMKKMAKDTLLLEYKKQEILNQCQYLDKTNCPEYYENNNKIHELLSGYMEQAFGKFYFIRVNREIRLVFYIIEKKLTELFEFI